MQTIYIYGKEIKANIDKIIIRKDGTIEIVLKTISTKDISIEEKNKEESVGFNLYGC